MSPRGSPASLGKALEPVVGDRLPRRRVRHELPPARPHAGVAVERAEAHAHARAVGVATEQLGPAFAAEALLPAAVRVTPARDELLPLEQGEGAAVDLRLHGRRGACAALAAGAVAVARGGGLLGTLDAHATAEATA